MTFCVCDLILPGFASLYYLYSQNVMVLSFAYVFFEFMVCPSMNVDIGV